MFLLLTLAIAAPPDADVRAALALAAAARERGSVRVEPQPKVVEKAKASQQAKPAPPTHIRWETDYYRATARAGDKPVLLLYTMSRGCLACDSLAAGALADKGVIAATAGFVCIKIDVLTQVGKALADEVGVETVPCITVHPKVGGKTAAGLSGNVPADEVLKALAAAKGVKATGPAPKESGEPPATTDTGPETTAAPSVASRTTRPVLSVATSRPASTYTLTRPAGQLGTTRGWYQSPG